MEPSKNKSLENHPEWVKKVLVVEDDKASLEALQMTLQSAGFEVHTAPDGEKAIKYLEKTFFAAVISDRKLPGISGLEVLKHAMNKDSDTARIIITGDTNVYEAADLINITHISHFILKPWDYEGLLKTVISCVEKYNIVRENGTLSELNRKQTEELEKHHETLQQELEIGGRIQKLLLDGKIPKDIRGISIQGITLPSQNIDGDFYDFYRPAHHLLDVAFGDVMGKGLPAALVGLAAKTQFTRFAHPLDIRMTYDKKKSWHIDVLEPDEILQKVSDEIYHSLRKLEHFVSLFYCRFNFKEQTVSYVDCGSTKPIHYQREKKEAVFIRGDNFPLGIGEADEEYILKKTTFKVGDLFIFYSDGLTECRSPEGDLFGTHRLKSLVEKYAAKSPDDLITLIKEETVRFTAQRELVDDLTLVVLKVLTSTPLEHKPPENIAKFISDVSQLQGVRKFIEKFCLQVSERTEPILTFIQLAVDEIFCNIVRHGYKGESGHEIIIQANFNESGLVFEVLDQGEPFDPSLIEHPSFVGDKEGGFGFYLVREVADQISYQRKKSERGWNSLRIVKNFNFEREIMDISHYEQDGSVIVTLEGENLDAKETPEFKKKVLDLIERENANLLVLNLSNLNFIDSTGLGSLLSLLRIINEKNGDMKLANMSKPIRTIFELVCMHKIFDIYPSVEEAIASFKTIR